MVDNDIDGELSETEAHDNYGLRVADWLSINALSLGLLTQDQAEQSLANMADYEAVTAEFLEPFVAMYQMEQAGFVSPHVEEAQVSDESKMVKTSPPHFIVRDRFWLWRTRMISRSLIPF